MPPVTPLESRSRDFYDRIAAGYDQAVDTEVCRDARACFWLRAAAELPAPARVLDFGAGTGLDTEHLAGLGHRVTAYDLSPGMLAVLRERCAAAIAAGTVETIAGTLGELEARLEGGEPFDGVVCNFAVLSMVQELGPVFRLFGRIVRPGGRLLISIQNPWNREELRTRGFWRALLAFPRHGRMRFHSAETGFTLRYLPWQVRRAARPEFRAAGRGGAWPDVCRSTYGPLGVFRLIALERR